MKSVFLGSFLKDIKKLRGGKLRGDVERAILDVEGSLRTLSATGLR